MQMAESDKSFFTNLVSDFKKEILTFMAEKFKDQEKLFNTRLAPIEKTQDRHTTDISDLYDSNRKVVDRFFSQDSKIESVKSQAMQQGERFGGKIEEIVKDIDEHKKDHDNAATKRGINIKWVIGIILMIIFSGTGMVLGILAAVNAAGG